MQAPIYTNLSPHPHTYARGTCKFSSHSNVLVVFLRRNPDLCTLGSSTPLDIPLTGVARRSSLLFRVCLGNEVQHPPEAYGLVQSSSFHGLNPYEELVHAISTRETIVRSSRGLTEPVAGVSTYISRILLSINACIQRGSHLGLTHGTYQPCTTLTHILGTHASFQMIPTFSWSSSGETLMIWGPRIIYPHRHSSDGGSPA